MRKIPGFLFDSILHFIPAASKNDTWLIVRDVLHAQELEHLEQSLAVVAEGHRPVVGIALLDEHVAVEPPHLRDGEHADAAEGLGMFLYPIAILFIVLSLVLQNVSTSPNNTRHKRTAP